MNDRDITSSLESLALGLNYLNEAVEQLARQAGQIGNVQKALRAADECTASVLTFCGYREEKPGGNLVRHVLERGDFTREDPPAATEKQPPAA